MKQTLPAPRGVFLSLEELEQMSLKPCLSMSLEWCGKAMQFDYLDQKNWLLNIGGLLPYAPSTMLKKLYMYYIMLTKTLWSKPCNYIHSTDEKIKAQKG
jgi:hypothetical protein